MSLITRIKNWIDRECLTHTDLNAEFSNITNNIIASDLTNKGMIERATDTEVADGTDEERAVTPAGMLARTGTTARIGLVQLEDSHTSVLTTKAPCSKNVKEAYDKAVGVIAGHSDITSAGANIEDAVTKKHAANGDTALGAQSENLNMNTHKVVGVVDPTTDQDAATKKYVDDTESIYGAAYYPDYNEADQGVTGNGKSTKAYIDTIAANNTTLVFRHNSGAATTTYTFATSEIIPANIHSIVEKGAILHFNTGVTLTDNGTLDDGLYKKFSFTGTGKIVLGSTLIQVAYPQWWGAKGDGTTDDTVAIQAAVDCFSSSGVVDLGTASYRIARNTGTNDRWGIKITNDDIILQGDGATLRRYNTDISTYALAYPIILVGTPDSNVASATENVTIKGINFIGEDTRHSTNGHTLHDGRYIIEFKNTKNIKVSGCKFTKVDSSAIVYQHIGTYDYANCAYYNTTKNYNSKVINNSFIAESHVVPARALIHAIATSGVDNLVIEGNYFEWCDDAVAGTTTYDDLNDAETDTYTDSHLATAVKRVGRNWVIANNTIYNSSEHVFYLAGMDVSITGNTLRVDDFTNCLGDIKIRSRNVSVSGNSIVSHGPAIALHEPSFNVSITNNSIYSDGDTSGGVIDIDSVGLTTFIDNRSDYLGTYYPMSNISVVGNSIMLPTATNSVGDGNAIRIYSDISDANYPEGQIRGITISGNTIKNHRVGVYFYNSLMRTITITGNTFDAKPFVSSGFAAGTTLNTHATIMMHRLANMLQEVMFNNNKVAGSEYLFATNDDSATNRYLPATINSNDFTYIKNFAMNDFRALGIANNSFRGNHGNFFLDRTSSWLNKYGTDNEMGDGTTAASYRTKYADHNYGATATTWSLSTQENLADYIVVTNASGAVNAILPSCIDGHTYTILNASGHVLTFKVTGQTGGTIANGKLAVYSAGASDVFECWEQP